MIWRCIISTKKYDEHHKLPWAGCTCKRARREKDRKFCTCFYSEAENVIVVHKKLHRLWHIMFPGSYQYNQIAEDLTLYYAHLHPASTKIIFRIGGVLASVSEELIIEKKNEQETIPAKQQRRIEKMSRRLDAFVRISHMKTIDHLQNDIVHIWLPPYVNIVSYRLVQEGLYRQSP